MTIDDTAQQALWYAWRQPQAAPLQAGPVLVVGGLPGVGLELGRDWDWLQSFKPHAVALQAQGLQVLTESPAAAHYAHVLVLAPRQRDEARAMLAGALQWLRPGGRLWLAAPNHAGARSVLADLQSLCGGLDGELSKHKCRVGWVTPVAAKMDSVRRADWTGLDAVRLADSGYHTRPGLFAWDRVDTASQLLSQHLPADLAGRVADLGAGYGYLASQLLRRCAAIKSIDLYEAEARALPAAALNIEAAQAATGCQRPVRMLWSDVSQGLDGRYEVIVSNPPFHLGRVDVPALGQAFIRAAAGALTPSGQLWLVANRHLPYEQLLRHRFGHVETVADATGFKVIKAGAVKES